MHTIATYWVLWLAVTVVCWGYCIFNQVRRMKRMVGGARTGDVESASDGFFSGLGTMMAVGLIGSVTGILFLVAVLFAVFGQR